MIFSSGLIDQQSPIHWRITIAPLVIASSLNDETLSNNVPLSDDEVSYSGSLVGEEWVLHLPRRTDHICN